MVLAQVASVPITQLIVSVSGDVEHETSAARLLGIASGLLVQREVRTRAPSHLLARKAAGLFHPGRELGFVEAGGLVDVEIAYVRLLRGTRRDGA